VKLQLWQN